MGVWKKGAVKHLLCSRWLWALLLCLSCARAGSAMVGYSLVTAGQCTDEPNRVALFDAAECMAAVANLSLSTSSSSLNRVLNDNFPPGCWHASNALSLNMNRGARAKPCGADGAIVRQCICASAPACTLSSGLIQNTMDCVCGGNSACTNFTGRYCSVATGRCSKFSTCAHGTGEKKNTGDCSCGEVDCTHDTGLYCDAGRSRCALAGPIRFCENVVGSEMNGNAISDTCACGSNDCNEATGMYCRESSSACSCAVISYELVQTGACEDVPGRLSIFGFDECDAGAKALGLPKTWSQSDSSSLSIPKDPTGCYLEGISYLRLKVNAATTWSNGKRVTGPGKNIGSCSSEDKCVCFLLHFCKNQNGTVQNEAECLCGYGNNTTPCSEDTGLYCYGLNSRCSNTRTEILQLSSGLCHSGAINRGNIRDETTCKEALGALGLFGNSSGAGAGMVSLSWTKHRPPFCSISLHSRQGHMNRYGMLMHDVDATYSDCSPETPCVCVSALTCLTNNGIDEGEGKNANRPLGMCICGQRGESSRTAICTESTGFVCHILGSRDYAKHPEFVKLGHLGNQCTHGPPCSNLNGIAPNHQGSWCTCGSNIDRSTEPFRVTKIECGQSTGMYCTTKNLTFMTKGYGGAYAALPLPVMVGHCSKSANLTFCPFTDGTALNPADDGRPCICGQSECDDSTGRFCHEDNSFCSPDPIDYMHVSLRKCKSGSELTNVDECTGAAASLNLVSSPTAGAIAVTQVWSLAGKIDLFTRTAQNQLNNALGNKSFNESVLFSPDEIERNAKAFRDNVLGCTLDANGTLMVTTQLSFRMDYFNLDGTFVNSGARAECTADKSCICHVDRPCTFTGGSAPNQHACLCGRSSCSQGTGAYCVSALSLCSRFPRCNVIGFGVLQNVTNETGAIQVSMPANTGCTVVNVSTVQNHGAELIVNGSSMISNTSSSSSEGSDIATLAILDGGHMFQIFHVLNGANLVLERLQIQNGRKTPSQCTLLTEGAINNDEEIPDLVYRRCCGGLIFVQGGASVTVRFSVFRDDAHAVPIWSVEKERGRLKVSSFRENSLRGLYFGGGFYVGRGSNLVSEHVQFIGLSSRESGGAIYFDRSGGASQISHSTFTHCRAVSSGGAVAMGRRRYNSPFDLTNDMIVRLDNSVFRNCTTKNEDSRGGGVANEGGHLHVFRTSLRHCAAGIMLIPTDRGFTTPTFSSTTKGGAFFCGKPPERDAFRSLSKPSNLTCSLQDVDVSHCLSTGAGGAGAVHFVEDFHMVNTNILHNIAMQNGGGLSIQTGALKAKIRIRDSRFLSNTANPVLQTRCLDPDAEYEPIKHIGKGGGISILKIKGYDVYSRTLEDFESAKTEAELDSDGFMLDIAISDSDFEDNHAASAGGAFFLSASWEDAIKQHRGEMLVLAGCKICNNHAKFGGGLYVSRGASLNLTASRTHRPNTISGNSAREGGGVYLANAEFHVKSDRTFKIMGNNATAKGGGISVGCSHLVCAGANSNACGGKIKIRKYTQLDRMCQTLLNLTEGLCFYEIQDYACPGPYTSLVFPEPGRIEKNTAGGSAPDIYVPVDVSDAVRRPNINCEAGSYSNPAKGSFASYTTSCLLCPRGWHQDEVGQDTCRICEVGTFSGVEGSLECSICEHGRFQSARAATSPCKVCEREGEITNNIRSGCQKPPWRIKSDCSHTQFLNDSWNNKSDYECVECPLGASCVGNINTSGIRAKFGWSRCPMQHNASVIPIFERCQFKGSCLGARNHELRGQFEGPNNADLALCRDIVDQTDDNYSSSSLGGINNVCRYGCNVEAGYRKDGRQCAACESGFSHGDLSGRCDKCPEEGVNIGLTILGILIGVVSAVVIVKITIGDSEAISLGNADSADAIKAIGLSFVQVFTLLTTFPIQWPAIFTFLFQIGGTVTVLGEHLVNLKCFFKDATEADVFFMTRVVWAIMPVILTCLCILTWAVINKVSPVADLILKIKISCVALLYLIWPSLCTNTFALFACRSVCGESYMQIDINVRCFAGQHAGFAGALGVPMLLLYVCGLPVGAMFALKRMVYAKNIAVAKNEPNGDAAGKLMDQFRIWGSFSAFYADETWFWEATVAVRKILIAMIGVFGSRMEGMQVHLTSMVIVASLIATAFTHPYRGHYRGLLQALEMICLGGIWLTLWAAAVFSEYPKCEVLGAGNRAHVWCDTIAVVVGVADVVIVLSCVVCFLAVKRWQSNASKSARVEDGGEIRGPGNNVQSGVEQHNHVELELATTGGSPRTADWQWQNNPCFTSDTQENLVNTPQGSHLII